MAPCREPRARIDRRGLQCGFAFGRAGSNDASRAPSAAPTRTASAASSAPAASASGPLGGGLLLVYQLDGTSPEKAKTETVYTLDIGSGAKKVLGSLPVTPETCCPCEIRFSADRRHAFLFAAGLRGIVDLQAGTVEPFAARVPNYGVLVSNKGDRLAWLDEITGTSETIVIADLAGKQLTRLTLPEGAWRSKAAWSPDDTTLAVTTYLPLRTGLAPDMRVASIVACCTIDRGPEVTHLLIVPVDGSPVREVFANTADVTKDQLVPIPSRPPTVVGDTPRVSRNLDIANWSPDGRSVLLTGDVCPPSWSYRYPAGACTYTFYAVDVETGVRTIAAEMDAPIMGMAWSPDARRMALHRRRRQQDERALCHGPGWIEPGAADRCRRGRYLVVARRNVDRVLANQLGRAGGSESP